MYSPSSKGSGGKNRELTDRTKEPHLILFGLSGWRETENNTNTTNNKWEKIKPTVKFQNETLLNQAQTGGKWTLQSGRI